MSVKQMALVWEHDFGHAEQSIMLALADHAHDDGTEIRPSVARLAWKTGYEPRQVQRILKHLRDDMKILVMTQEGGGRGKPNVYRFDWRKGVKKSPFSAKRVTSEAKKGDIAETPEPSSLEPSSSRRASGDVAFPDIEDDTFAHYVALANAQEVITTPEDRTQTARHFKDLKRLHEPDRTELNKVVAKMLEARTSGFDMSPQKALDKVRNGNVSQLRPVSGPSEQMASTAGYRSFE